MTATSLRARTTTARVRGWGQASYRYRAPLAYAVLLCGQSLYLLAQRPAGFRIDLRAFAAHQTLLLALVCLQAALWYAVGPKRAARWLAIGLAALVQGSLLLLYLANHLSLHYVEIALDWATSMVYLAEPGPLLEAVGMAPTVLAFVFALYVAACLWVTRLALGLFPPPRSIRTSAAFLLAAAVCLTPLFAAPDYYRKREFLLALQGRTPAAFGPPALFFSSGLQRQSPRYDAAVVRGAIDPRPLVLITLDSARPDTLGVFGGPFANTPFLSRLRDEGRLTLYSDAHSICTFSFCGIMGVLSSRQWREFTAPPDTIFDALAAHGYRNHAFLAGQFRNYFELSRQFGPTVAVLRDGLDRPGHINDDSNLALWLNALPENREPRQFFYLHLMSLHRLGGYQAQDDFGKEASLPLGVRDTPDIRAYRQRHFASVRKADAAIAAIFSRLDDRGLLQDALVIITADHGEYLGEGGLVAHGKPPHRAVTRVPMMIYDARRARWPQRSPVSTTDAAPTLLAAIGAPVPLEWSGIALQRRTGRCAVESASDGHRVIIGEAADKPWRLWDVAPGPTRTAGTFLASDGALATPSAPIASAKARAIAARLKACADRR